MLQSTPSVTASVTSPEVGAVGRSGFGVSDRSVPRLLRQSTGRVLSAGVSQTTRCVSTNGAQTRCLHLSQEIDPYRGDGLLLGGDEFKLTRADRLVKDTHDVALLVIIVVRSDDVTRLTIAPKFP